MPYIRPAEDKDIKDIEYICRMTAGPQAKLSEDIGRKIALTYSTYYARAEQDTSFVLDDNGKAVGYILCAPDFSRYIKGYRKNEVRQLWKIDKLQFLTAYFLPFGYLPFKKKYPAHLHIDLLGEYQGKGYFSKLLKFMLEDLKNRGYEKVTLGVEPEETKNKEIYFHYGFTEHIKNGVESYPDGTTINVEYYGKRM